MSGFGRRLNSIVLVVVVEIRRHSFIAVQEFTSSRYTDEREGRSMDTEDPLRGLPHSLNCGDDKLADSETVSPSRLSLISGYVTMCPS